METKTQSTYAKYILAAMKSLEKNKSFVFIENPTDDEFKHIADIGASIMMQRDGVRPGSGFTTAVLKNDMYDAFSRADSTCERAMKFFAVCTRLYVE